MKSYPDIIQGSDEWFKLRLGKPTSSNCSIISAKGKSGSASKGREDYMIGLAYERMYGIPFPKKFKGNASMDWGTETEDEGRIEFVKRTGLVVDQVGFIEHDDGSGYSPDGLIVTNTTIEIKCPETLTQMRRVGGAPLSKAIRYQIQDGLRVSEREQCWFISYDPRVPGKHSLHYRLIKRDEEVIKEIRVGLVLFVDELKEMVEKLTPTSPF